MLRKVVRLIWGLVYLFVKGGVCNARRLGVTVGEGCRIYTSKFGTEPFLITIGDRVTVTSGVVFLTHDGSTSLVRNEAGRRYQRYAPISIGDDVFIGVNSIILPGVAIGRRVVVAAGSVVTKDVPDDSVVAGVPARAVSSFEAFERKIVAQCANDSELEEAGGYRSRVALAIEIQSRKTSDTGVAGSLSRRQ